MSRNPNDIKHIKDLRKYVLKQKTDNKILYSTNLGLGGAAILAATLLYFLAPASVLVFPILIGAIGATLLMSGVISGFKSLYDDIKNPLPELPLRSMISEAVLEHPLNEKWRNQPYKETSKEFTKFSDGANGR